MRCVIMEFPIIKQNSVVRMVQFQEMFQRARWLLLCILDIVDFHRGNVDSLLLG